MHFQHLQYTVVPQDAAGWLQRGQQGTGEVTASPAGRLLDEYFVCTMKRTQRESLSMIKM